MPEPLPLDAATAADLPQITAIYNDVIATTTAVFSEVPVTVEDRAAWLAEKRAAGLPVLVARDGDVVAGFATYGPFRPWPGFRTSVEHSVHVARSHRRRGLGRRLVQALLDEATAAGLHVMVAGVDGSNAASIALHEALGFEQVGRMPEIATKFDRWLELVFLQRRLGDA